jgi:hypothetical protein
MTLHVVQYSGGISSWAVARDIIDRYETQLAGITSLDDSAHPDRLCAGDDPVLDRPAPLRQP